MNPTFINQTKLKNLALALGLSAFAAVGMTERQQHLSLTKDTSDSVKKIRQSMFVIKIYR
jgi:hypothetical protein